MFRMKRRELQAFSLFPYFRKRDAKTENQKRLQGLLYALKDGDQVRDDSGRLEAATAWFAKELLEGIGKLIPPEFLGTNTYVVPIPSSTGQSTPPSRSDWPMYDVAMRLYEAGAVCGAGPVIVRHIAVKKAHLVSSDEKPSVKLHANSMTANLDAVPDGCEITLLDDVLTSGSTAMGAWLALSSAGFPGRVRVVTATHTVASDYEGDDAAAAESWIVWLAGESRARRPSEKIHFVD